MVMPHYEVREAIDFVSSNGGLQANTTLLTTPEPDLRMGMNVVYNATEIREMQYIVNARDGSGGLRITGHRCVDYCKIDDVEEDEDMPHNLWSNPKVWVDHREKYGRNDANG